MPSASQFLLYADLQPEGLAALDAAPDEAAARATLAELLRMPQGGLRQDVLLIGPPGSQRLRLAKCWAALARREVEYVALSADTTEAELKQRREVVGGRGLARRRSLDVDLFLG